MTYNLNKSTGTFKGRTLPILNVTDKDGNLVFRFPVQGELVFATTSLNRLWVLEHTPVGDFSTEVDLETSKACSRQMEGDDWGPQSLWMYRNDNGQDQWLRKV